LEAVNKRRTEYAIAKRTDIELRKITQTTKYLATRTNKGSTEEGH